MARFASALAASIIALTSTVPIVAHAAIPGPAAGAAARRYDWGSSTQFTARARIVRTSASIGAGHSPPQPRMVPRRATISATDGRPVAALIYDIE